MTFSEQILLKGIKNFFVRLRYHARAEHDSFKIDIASPELEMILQRLHEHRHIDGYIIDEDKKKTKIYLGFDSECNPLITDVRFSSSSTVSLAKIRKFARKYPNILAFVHTSQGILTFAECRFFGCGGKILAIIL